MTVCDRTTPSLQTGRNYRGQFLRGWGEVRVGEGMGGGSARKNSGTPSAHMAVC